MGASESSSFLGTVSRSPSIGPPTLIQTGLPLSTDFSTFAVQIMGHSALKSEPIKQKQ